MMIQEAGGRVTDFKGNIMFLEGHHIVATNGALHDTFLEVIQECLPEGL